VDRSEDAPKVSDIICTTTTATSPVLRGEWLSTGAHINAIAGQGFRELDSEAVAKSRLFVDRLESTLNESDDFIIPNREGRIGKDHVRGEVGDILIGKVQGRTNEKEVTIFKSLGVAVQDLAAGHYVYMQAKSKNIGTWLEFNGERHGVHEGARKPT